MYLFEFAVSHAELGWVVLAYEEHLIVLLPIVLEVCIIHDYQVDCVQVCKHASKVVKYLKVHIILLEELCEELSLSLEEPVHLVDDVFCEGYNLLNGLEEITIDSKHARHLNLELAC